MSDHSLQTQETRSDSFQYRGNMALLIILLIFFLPFGVLLLLKNGTILKDTSRISLHYKGSWGWVFFWTVFFFPIAILLLAFNGSSIVHTKIPAKS